MASTETTSAVAASNGDTRPRGQTTAAVEDHETWVEAKRFTMYKVMGLLYCEHVTNPLLLPLPLSPGSGKVRGQVILHLSTLQRL